MFDFIKLTLSSNGKPTFIRVNAIVQVYEDANADGKKCTKIEFEEDFTRVKEDMFEVMTLIRSARINSIYGLTGGFTHTHIDTDSLKNVENEGVCND